MANEMVKATNELPMQPVDNNSDFHVPRLHLKRLEDFAKVAEARRDWNVIQIVCVHKGV